MTEKHTTAEEIVKKLIGYQLTHISYFSHGEDTIKIAFLGRASIQEIRSLILSVEASSDFKAYETFDWKNFWQILHKV